MSDMATSPDAVVCSKPKRDVGRGPTTPILVLGILAAGTPSPDVAGTMAADAPGLRLATLRNPSTARVPTRPAAILLSGTLHALVRRII